MLIWRILRREGRRRREAFQWRRRLVRRDRPRGRGGRPPPAAPAASRESTPPSPRVAPAEVAPATTFLARNFDDDGDDAVTSLFACGKTDGGRINVTATPSHTYISRGVCYRVRFSNLVLFFYGPHPNMFGESTEVSIFVVL